MNNDKKEADIYLKIKSIIDSCSEMEHFRVAAKMIKNFKNQVSYENDGLVDLLIDYILNRWNIQYQKENETK